MTRWGASLAMVLVVSVAGCRSAATPVPLARRFGGLHACVGPLDVLDNRPEQQERDSFQSSDVRSTLIADLDRAGFAVAKTEDARCCDFVVEAGITEASPPFRERALCPWVVVLRGGRQYGSAGTQKRLTFPDPWEHARTFDELAQGIANIVIEVAPDMLDETVDHHGPVCR